VSYQKYRAPFLLRNGHSLSIFPTLFRRVDARFLERETIATRDGDFLNLDWGFCHSKEHRSQRLVILSHGLEGHSRRHYMAGMAKAVIKEGWDVLGWNFRSCGGEMNRKLRFYHSGATEDLNTVIEHAISFNIYQEIVLAGFSIGGNLSLVYLGEKAEHLPPVITKAVVFSVPCDLADSAQQLAKAQNTIYMRRFLKSLKKKMEEKKKQFPGEVDLDNYQNIRNFQEFDDRYTAPIHGFRDANHYWQACSSRRFISKIRVPTLIINARDDPFLGPACYPKDEVAKNPMVTLETPQSGGHVGFVSFNPCHLYWSEQRVVHFLSDNYY